MKKTTNVDTCIDLQLLIILPAISLLLKFCFQIRFQIGPNRPTNLTVEQKLVTYNNNYGEKTTIVCNILTCNPHYMAWVIWSGYDCLKGLL